MFSKPSEYLGIPFVPFVSLWKEVEFYTSQDSAQNFTKFATRSELWTVVV